MTDQTHAAQAAQVAQSPAEEANPKTLAASVLLAAPHWDPAAFAADFEGDWGVKVEGVPSNPGEPLAFRAMGSIIVVGMNPCEIPDRMAEAHAKNNPDREGATEAALAHRAHLVVAAIAETAGILENARNLVRAVASLTLSPGVLAVDAATMLFTPEGYRNGAALLADPDAVPVMNLVAFGTWRRSEEGATCGYTAGLAAFGLPECEVLECAQGSETVRGFLANVARWQLAHVDAGEVIRGGDELKGGIRAELKPGAAFPEYETLQFTF